MTKAIRVYEHGGPEVMKWEDVDVGAPAEGEVRVKHTAVGLNYIDVYFRVGLYPAPLPHGIGLEAAGVIEEIGPGVAGLSVGDRVAYACPPVGSYAEARVMPAAGLIKIPDNIDDSTAAAMMLQGMTTEYLLQRTYKVKPGDTILFHAAAGGVGLLACQWAKHIGATVIGTVGSAEKRHWPDPSVAITPSITPKKILPTGLWKSPMAKVCRSSMIPSARIRLKPLLIVCSRVD